MKFFLTLRRRDIYGSYSYYTKNNRKIDNNYDVKIVFFLILYLLTQWRPCVCVGGERISRDILTFFYFS